MQRKYSRIMAAGILTCVLTGFSTGIMEISQEAEAALLPSPPAVAERQRLSGNKV